MKNLLIKRSVSLSCLLTLLFLCSGCGFFDSFKKKSTLTTNQPKEENEIPVDVDNSNEQNDDGKNNNEQNDDQAIEPGAEPTDGNHVDPQPSAPVSASFSNIPSSSSSSSSSSPSKPGDAGKKKEDGNTNNLNKNDNEKEQEKPNDDLNKNDNEKEQEKPNDDLNKNDNEKEQEKPNDDLNKNDNEKEKLKNRVNKLCQDKKKQIIDEKDKDTKKLSELSSGDNNQPDIEQQKYKLDKKLQKYELMVQKVDHFKPFIDCILKVESLDAINSQIQDFEKLDVISYVEDSSLKILKNELEREQNMVKTIEQEQEQKE